MKIRVSELYLKRIGFNQGVGLNFKNFVLQCGFFLGCDLLLVTCSPKREAMKCRKIFPCQQIFLKKIGIGKKTKRKFDLSRRLQFCGKNNFVAFYLDKKPFLYLWGSFLFVQFWHLAILAIDSYSQGYIMLRLQR